MPSKKSKQMDQRRISLAEYQKNKKLRRSVRAFLQEQEFWFLAGMSDKFSLQLATRFKNSAKRQGISVIALAEKLERKAKK